MLNRRLNLPFLLGLLVAVAAIGGGTHWVHGYFQQRNVGTLLKEADRAERRGDLVQVEKYLERYLAFRPADGDALARYALARAESASTSQDRIQALQVLERALQYPAQRDKLRRRAAELAMSPELGMPKEAMRHLFHLLLKPSPTGAVATEDRLRLESLLLEFGRQDPSQTPSPSLVEHLARPDGALEELLGRCFEEQARTGRRDEADAGYRKALACYRLALDREPARVGLYVRQAALLRGPLGNAAQADQVMDARVIQDGVLAKNPQAYAAYLARAQYRKEFTLPGAADDIARAQQLAPEAADVIVAAGNAALELGNFVEARTLLERGVARFPRDVRMYQALSETESKAGRPDEAVAVLRRGDKALPGQKNLQWNLAERLIHAGRPEARTVLDRLRQQTEMFQPAVDYLEARLLLNEGQMPKAVRRLESARALMANVADLRDLTVQADLLLAQCYEQLGNPEQQLLAARRAANLHPKSVVAQLVQAKALRDLDRTGEALEAYRKLAPESAEARVSVARLLLAQSLQEPDGKRRWAEVDQALNKADRSPENRVEVAILRAEALAARGQLVQAREKLLHARITQPTRIEPWIALAELAGREGNREAVLAVLNEAQKELGDRVEIRLARADYWGQRGGEGAREALESLYASRKTLPTEDRIRIEKRLGDSFAQLGEDRRALQIWSEVGQERPDDLRAALRLFEVALRVGDQEDGKRLARVGVDRLHRIEGEDGVLWRFGEATLLVRQARLPDAKRFDQARLLLAEVAKHRPEWSQVPLLEAEIAEQEGSSERAIEAYLKAIERGERSARVLRRAVELLNEHRRYDEADRVIQGLLDQGPFLGILGQLAAEKALRHQNRTEALALAGRAVALESRDYRDHLWLGQICWSIGEKAKAEAGFRRAVELAETVPETWIAWVEYLSKSGRQSQAEAAYRQAEAKLPAERAPLALALCSLALGQLDRAELQLQTTLAARPNEPVILRAVADFYLGTGQLAKADPYLQTILEERTRAPEPMLIWARRKRAYGLTLQGGYPQIREGLRLIEQNLKVRDDFEDRRAKALLLAKVPGGLHDAIRTLEELERRQPSTSDERFILAQLYESAGDWPRARSLMLGLLAADGENVAFLAGITRSLVRQGQVDEAQTWLDRLEKTLPDHPQTIELKARGLAARNLAVEAASLLRDYVKPKEKDSYVSVFAALLEELGQFDAAEAMFRDAVGRSQQPETALVLAEYLARRGRLSEALDLCERAWTVCDPEAVGRSCLRMVYAAKADDSQLRRIDDRLEQAVEKNPNSIMLQFDLANLSSYRGDYRKAEALYRRIVERSEGNDGPLNNLAWLLAVAENKGSEALTVIGQAIALAGPTPALLDTRATIHITMDRGDLAIKDLESAISNGPAPEMFLHLAQARLSKKDRAGADAAIRDGKAAGLRVEMLHPLERKAYDQLVAALSRR